MPGRLNRGKKKQTLVVAMGKLSSLFYAGNLYQPSVSTVFRAGPTGRFISTKTNEQVCPDFSLRIFSFVLLQICLSHQIKSPCWTFDGKDVDFF